MIFGSNSLSHYNIKKVDVLSVLSIEFFLLNIYYLQKRIKWRREFKYPFNDSFQAEEKPLLMILWKGGMKGG